MRRAPRTRSLLTEHVRQRLARTLCTRYRDQDRRLHVVTLDPALEERIQAGFEHGEEGLAIRLPPREVESICRLLRTGIGEARGGRTSADRVGQPRNPPGSKTPDRRPHPAIGRAELQRDHAGYEDRIGGDGVGSGAVGSRQWAVNCQPRTFAAWTRRLNQS